MGKKFPPKMKKNNLREREREREREPFVYGKTMHRIRERIANL